MSKIAYVLVILLCIGFNAYADEDTIDGKSYENFDVTDWGEMAAPGVSATGSGRIYFDATANVFKVSENGGAYANLVGGGGGVSDTAYAGSWNGVTTIAPSKNAVYDKIEVMAASSAPVNAQYLVSTADATLSAEVNLGALTTGLLKHTVAAGVSTPATATAGVDYYNPGGTDVAVADGGTGKSSWTQYLIPYADTTTSFSQIAIGTAGQILVSGGAGLAPSFSNNVTLGTVSGAVDAGGATSFEVPNGANPTVSVAGQISVDTSATSGSAFRFYGDAQYTLPAWQRISFVVDTPTASSDYSLGSFPANMTIKQIRVLCTGGTNLIGGLDEADANGANIVAVDSDITATAGTTATDDGTLTNPTIDANDQLNWHTTSISGTPTSVTVTVYFIYDAVN